MRLKLFLLLLLLVYSVLGDDYEEDIKRRNKEHENRFRVKRQINSLPLVYPYGATYRLILGLAAPVKAEEDIPLIFGASFLYQFVQFQNITELSQYYAVNTISREQRAITWEHRKDERLVFYKAVEEMLNVRGFNGRDCVLRAICELAQYPVDEEGLVGELIHILFTPNYGRAVFVNDVDSDEENWRDLMGDYIDAYTAGSQMFSCSYIYRGCPEGEGILELVPAVLEPSGIFRDDGKRPDGMTLLPWHRGRPLVWDATCVDTLAASHVQTSSICAGSAAANAENSKRRKYSSIDDNYLFVPFGVETLGPWGPEARQLVKSLTSRLIETSGDRRAGAYLGQRISLAIQRGNVASVLGTLPAGSDFGDYLM